MQFLDFSFRNNFFSYLGSSRALLSLSLSQEETFFVPLPYACATHCASAWDDGGGAPVSSDDDLRRRRRRRRHGLNEQEEEHGEAAAAAEEEKKLAQKIEMSSSVHDQAERKGLEINGCSSH